jgi:hypothetical protein
MAAFLLTTIFSSNEIAADCRSTRIHRLGENRLNKLEDRIATPGTGNVSALWHDRILSGIWSHLTMT